MWRGVRTWRHDPLWLVDYRFCDVPAYTPRFSTLVSPAVVFVPTVIERPALAASQEPGRWEMDRLPPSPVPEPAREEELRVTSGRELGDVYLRLGEPESALRVYREHLGKLPGDARAWRSSGLAMLVANRSEAEAFKAIERAYRIQPDLAWSPVRVADFESAYVFRALTDRVLESARRRGSAPGWLTAAVLLQADGRAKEAREAVARARDRGLEAVVARELERALP